MHSTHRRSTRFVVAGALWGFSAWACGGASDGGHGGSGGERSLRGGASSFGGALTQGGARSFGGATSPGAGGRGFGGATSTGGATQASGGTTSGGATSVGGFVAVGGAVEAGAGAAGEGSTVGAGGGEPGAGGAFGAGIIFDPTGATSLKYDYTGKAILTASTLVKLNVVGGTEIRVATLPTTSETFRGRPLVTNPSTRKIASIHADESNVYYGMSGSPNATVLWKSLTAAENAASEVAVTLPDENYARIITSDTRWFYLVNQADMILMAAKKLSSAQAASAPIGLENARGAVSDLVVAGVYLYWLEAPNVVYAYSLQSGHPPIAIDSTGQTGSYASVDLATDGSYVYWSTHDGASRKIRRVSATIPPSAGAVQDVVLDTGSVALWLTVDASHVYYTDGSTGVWRTEKNGAGSPMKIFTPTAPLNFYAMFGVDDSYVYGVGNAGQILRVGKTTSGK